MVASRKLFLQFMIARSHRTARMHLVRNLNYKKVDDNGFYRYSDKVIKNQKETVATTDNKQIRLKPTIRSSCNAGLSNCCTTKTNTAKQVTTK